MTVLPSDWLRREVTRRWKRECQSQFKEWVWGVCFWWRPLQVSILCDQIYNLVWNFTQVAPVSPPLFQTCGPQGRSIRTLSHHPFRDGFLSKSPHSYYQRYITGMETWGMDESKRWYPHRGFDTCSEAGKGGGGHQQRLIRLKVPLWERRQPV